MPQVSQARQELIQNNMALVPFIYEKMNPMLPVAMTEEDALQYGYLGLVEAALKFDFGQYKFSTYASIRIRGAILDGIDTFRWFSIRKKDKEMPVVFSLAEWIEKEEDLPDLSFLEAVDTMFESEKLRKAVTQLSEEEQTVLYLYYVHDESLRKIAAENSLCRNRVVALKRSALSKLRTYFAMAEKPQKTSHINR